jgi:SNF2 family DNA or RNA helicase
MDEELEAIELVDESLEKPLKEIEVFPYQKAHFEKVVDILENELAYLDVSAFGSGKTHICLAVAAVFQMKILIVGPKTVLPNWMKICPMYGLELADALTYSGLRGNKRGYKHDWLQKSEDGETFTATPEFVKLAKEGLLLVFDECHNLKNDKSQQLNAAHEMVKTCNQIAKEGGNVRVACLSATPADKKEHITSLFKILGIIHSENLYRYDRSSKTYISVGLQEAVNKCNRYDPDTTFHIICRPINKTTSKLICHQLYTRVLKKRIVSSMPEPPIEAQKDIKNLFAIMPPEDVERMKEGALLFASATSYSQENGEVNYRSVKWGDVIRSRREIDSAKVNTMVRLSKERLEENPNCKVVLYFTFKRDMHESKRQLKKYNPIVMNGDVTKMEERTKMMDNFQANDNNYRVFISNPKVGGLGVELDDKFGNHPRFMFIAPSYMFIDQFQATGRIHRKETKSKATVRFIYSREFPWETSLLNSIAEKSRVARDMLTENNREVVFPGEYNEEIEKYPGEEEEI